MILLLAGTGEARDIAAGLAERRLPATASLAGATRAARAIALPTRVGGFGGEAAFRDYLLETGVTAIIDATHPFAARISARTARVAAALGLPCLAVLRPEWRPGPGDLWTPFDREEEVAAHVPIGATVFLATGRQTLEQFAGLAGRRVICRQIDPPTAPFPFEGGEFLVGRPPFSVEDERRLFSELGVDVLVVKNSGGAASATKLDAARALGLPVLMQRRPPPPSGARVETAAEALDWADRL